MMQSETSY